MQSSKSSSKRVILSVLAHPDDESFGMGGTLAYYAEKGVEVHLVCATRGEVGEVGPEYLKEYDSIAELRESELRCAAGHLGLAKVHFLDYRDSGMVGAADNTHPDALAVAPVGEVAEKVAHYIRKLKPQVVLTFDPIGGYRHPDHIAAHKATLKAFDLAADPNFESEYPPHQPEKLYYHTFPKNFLKLAVWALRLTGKDPRRWGQNEDIDLVSIMDQEFPTHAQIDYREVEERKEAAAKCHASQGGGGNLSNGIVSWLFSLFLRSGKDNFMRAYPPMKPGEHEDDLFAGIS